MAQNFFLKEPTPTKVQVVNDSENPQSVEVKNLPLNSAGNINVNVAGGTITLSSMRPSASTLYIVQFDNILLLQSDGTFVPIPLNSLFMSLNQTLLNNLLDSYKTAYATLVSGVSAATLHYSKQTQNGSVTSEVYNLKD